MLYCNHSEKMELAMSKMEHLHAQAQAMLAQHGRASPSLSHSSPEPPTPPISRGPSMSAVHGAMLSHGHDLLMGKLHKVSYSSPPPIACSPENNLCKLINYRNAKVAAFVVDGRELICLPQAFELFLKHLVGGLHTVYTKLKRLDITPIVCNVEQVRVLRGLGAIQPGVNRCKLISCKEFDILYDDCTNSSARPGRPPKRSPSLHASPETIDKLKKARFDAPDYYNTRLFDAKNFLNGFPHHPYAMGHLPFMQLNHPLLAPPVNLAMAQQLGLRGHEGLMVGGRDNTHPDHDRIPSSDERKERDSPSPRSVDLPYHPAFQKPHKEQDENTPLNLHINGRHHSDDLQTSPIRRDPSDDEDDIDDDNPSDDDKSAVDSGGDMVDPLTPSETGEISQPGSPQMPPLSNGTLQGYSSIETLLMNIQGLLKVAAENARHQDRQVSELKLELYQEKKAREDINKHLVEVQQQKSILRKRLRRARRDRKSMESPTEMNEPRLLTPTKSDLSSAITATTPRPGNGVLPQDSPPLERFGNSVGLGESDRNAIGAYTSGV